MSAPRVVLRCCQDGDAVGAQQCTAGALQDAEADQRRKIWRHAAQCRPDTEERETEEVKDLPAKHLADLIEGREQSRVAEQVPDRHPANVGDMGSEGVGQRRQSELHDGRIELPQESAGAAHAHDQPRVVASASKERARRRLGQSPTKVGRQGSDPSAAARTSA